MFNDNSVQSVVLATIQKEQRKMHLFTINGFRVNGRIVAADQYTILLEDENGEQNLVYKHAISTIALPKTHKFAFDQAAAKLTAKESGESEQ